MSSVGAKARLWRWTIGATMALTLLLASNAQAAFSDFGLASVSATETTTQAGDHPDVFIGFKLNTDPSSTEDPPGVQSPYARFRDATFELPPGLIGNPNATPQCTTAQFATFTTGGAGCPQDTQVGITKVVVYRIQQTLTEPVYNMAVPSNGDTVARLGFYSANTPFFVTVRVRSGTDYGLTATIEGPPSVPLVSAVTELWGVPADSSHDTLRLTPKEAYPEFKSESPPRSSGIEPLPFMSNPTSCGMPLSLSISVASYQEPDRHSALSTEFPETTGCSKLEFAPKFSALPTSRQAAAPTGLDVALKIPQNEAPNGLSTSELRGATVTLPAGMTIASGAADGLAACSAEQVGLEKDIPSACPDAAKIGTAEFDVPALSRRIEGALYQRTPEPGNLFRIWLVTDELGVHVKLPGEIRTNPQTGQVTSVFVDTPQVPLRELVLHFKGGSHGVLANPPACGTYQTHYEFNPWSGNAPAVGDTPMTIDEGCNTGSFSPGLSAGAVNPVAGAYSPFVLSLSRQDGEQNVRALDVALPAGLLAKLKGVPLCTGAAAATGACDAASKVGTTSVAAGPGPTPLWLPQPGKDPTAVYLSGAYKGAPYSLVVKVPAQAGPFDLGTVVTRAGLYVDPVTAQATVKSDPLPQILEGVPVLYRSINVNVDRPGFTLNPTSCKAMAVRASVLSSAGATATPSSRFRLANCADLAFRPKLSLRLKGKSTRRAYPALTAVLKAKEGEANIERVSVALPRSEFLAQEHIRTICTRVQFAADNCPSGSVYGFARAITPLLAEPLEGPVYLRSSNHQLPDLVAALHGPIDIELAGRIDSFKGGLRTTFAAVPDAPVSKFVLKMKGGKKGLIVNSTNLCSADNRATVRMTAHSGKRLNFKPRLKVSCPKKHR